LAILSASSANAATPTMSTKVTPLDINIRTAGDLADACTISPTSKTGFARVNFCNGFAQGILQINGQSSSGAKICIPNLSPKRSETMREFASWVRADATRKDELASEAFLRFMAGRFPCT
jgi:hypothetical protein